MADVRIEGLAEFQKAIKFIQKKMPTAGRDAARASADATVRYARPKVPVITGTTVNSIDSETVFEGGVVTGGEGLEHYAYLELGGRSGRRHAHYRPYIANGRYIYPAYEENQDLVTKAMQDELKKIVRLAGLKIS
jgi:hypothetical protein